MKNEVIRHTLGYAVLILGLVGFALLFMAAWPHPVPQRLVVVSMASFYICWGLATHYKSNHLTARIILEYIGVAGLGALILSLLTLW